MHVTALPVVPTRLSRSFSDGRDFHRSSPVLIAWIGLGIVLFTGTTSFAADAKIEFNRDIRPILSDNCFTCHGQDNGARKAKLRLDDREHALLGGKSEAPGIVPGK